MKRAARLPGALALALVLALTFGSLAAVLARSEGLGRITTADWAALRFTLVQAVLSAALSTLLAIPVARALARRRFAGRGLLITALGAPFILPTLVAVMGLLSIFGRSGVLNSLLARLGLPVAQIYGLQGILIAHLFLNLPLAVRMILNGWAAIPPEHFRLAASLGFGAREVRRLIEVPMLRATLPGAALAIFLVCLTSFTVVLMMGGGPRATTLELAIYQAFRMEFDLGHAASLALLQMVLSLAVAGVALRAMTPTAFGAGRGLAVDLLPPAAGGALWLDRTVLLLCGLFLALPLASILLTGLPHLAGLGANIWMAAGRSVLLALTACSLAVILSLSIALLITGMPRPAAHRLDGLAMLALTASPLVLGTGLFLILRPFADPVALALPMAALINATMAMPFCLRILLPQLTSLRADYGRLAESLGLSGFAALRLLILPRLRRPLAFAGGLSAALAAGDLGAVALFADPQYPTLPMQLYALAGAYRNNQAAGAAILLMGLSFLLFRAIDLLGHRNADA